MRIGRLKRLLLAIATVAFASALAVPSMAWAEDAGGAVEVTTYEDLKAALDAGKSEIVVADDIAVAEALTIPAGVVVTVENGSTLRVLDSVTNNGAINGEGAVSVSVMVKDSATSNGSISGTAPACTVTYDISLDGGTNWIADTTNGKAQAVTVKTDGTIAVSASFQSAFTSAKTDEIVHMLTDAHVQSANSKKNNGPLRSYYGLILEGNGHTIFTDLESDGASNEYSTIKFTSYLAGTGPEVSPVLRNVTIDSQKNAKADLDIVSGDVTFTVTLENVKLLGNCQYASFASTSPSFIINKSNVEIYDSVIPSWDAGSAKAINIYSGGTGDAGPYSMNMNGKCTLYGGTYTKDVKAYVAEGYGVVFNEGKDTYTVKPVITVKFDDATMVDGNKLPEFTYTTNFDEVSEDGEMLVVETPEIQVSGEGEYEITADAYVFMSDKYIVEVTPGKLTVVKAVAKIGDAFYGSVEEAANAAGLTPGVDTITLIANHEISEPSIIVTDVILELNGYTITGAKNAAGAQVYPVIRVQNGANVIVKDSIGEGVITNADYVFVLGASDGSSAGNLTIESGKFHGQTSVASVTKGVLTIKGGEFSVDPYREVTGQDGEGNDIIVENYNFLLNCIDANYNDGSAKIVVEGGTFAVFNPQSNKAEGEGTDFVASGYYAAGNNGMWTVKPIPPYIPPIDPLPGTGCGPDAACNYFNDVDANAWYHEVIDWAYENGILRGYDDGSGNVGPEDATLRAHVAVMMWRMAGEPVAAKPADFNDVKAGAWYADAVAWVQETGLFVGYQDGSGNFGPYDIMTREQMSTVLWRFAQMQGVDVSVGEDTNILSYLDADQIDSWAVPAMQWAVGAGIISGYTENGEPTGYLGPKDDAERAHFAAMLQRMDVAYKIL